MKNRGLKLIILFSILLFLQSNIFSIDPSYLDQDVKIEQIIKVGFTSRSVSSEAEFNFYKHPETYENLLSSQTNASSYFPSKDEHILICNSDNLVYLSIVTNVPVKINLEVNRVDGKIKGMQNKNGSIIPFYFYNQGFSSSFKNTQSSWEIGTGYQVNSYPIMIYTLKSETTNVTSGRYVGSINVTITATGWYMKKVLVFILILLSVFSAFAANTPNVGARSFSYVIKKDIKEPFKVIFADKSSSEGSIITLSKASLRATDTFSLAYYIVLAVRDESKPYKVAVTVSPFTNGNNKVLPAKIYVQNEGKSRSNESIDINEYPITIDLDGNYGLDLVTGDTNYYFFGFSYSFPKTASYVPDTYTSTVKVEVSGA